MRLPTPAAAAATLLTACPFDPEGGPMYIRETIRVIDALDITDVERDQIYRHNIRGLMRLPDGRA